MLYKNGLSSSHITFISKYFLENESYTQQLYYKTYTRIVTQISNQISAYSTFKNYASIHCGLQISNKTVIHMKKSAHISKLFIAECHLHG